MHPIIPMLLVDRLHLEEEVKVLLNGKFLEHEGYFFNLAYLCKKLEADGPWKILLSPPRNNS